MAGVPVSSEELADIQRVIQALYQLRATMDEVTIGYVTVHDADGLELGIVTERDGRWSFIAEDNNT